MNQEEFFTNDDLFFEAIPEFNAPNTKQESSDNFFETMEWDPSFSNNKDDDNSFFLENLFNTEGNIFNNNTISPNNEVLFNSTNQISPNNNVMIKQEKSIPEIIMAKQEEQEESTVQKTPLSKKTKLDKSPSTEMPNTPSPSNTPKKKSKKDMTPEELEEKKRMQLEKRLIKNRRTAEISRKRKKAKKSTLEESLIQLEEQSKQLEKQSIEVSTENRILKTEYYALLSLILSIPALAQKFDKISEIVVEQQKDNKIGQIASVYLFNIIYSIHQQWIQMKQSLTSQTTLQNNTPLVQNVIVN